MTKAPKFSWEAPSGGSLKLRIQSGDRDVSWTIGKTATLARVYNVMEEIQIEINRNKPNTADMWPADYNPWPNKPGYGPTDAIPDLLPHEPISEEESHAALAARADSFKVTADGMWDRPMEDYDEDEDE